MAFGTHFLNLAGIRTGASQISNVAIFIENALRLVSTAPRLQMMQTYTQ